MKVRERSTSDLWITRHLSLPPCFLSADELLLSLREKFLAADRHQTVDAFVGFLSPHTHTHARLPLVSTSSRKETWCNAEKWARCSFETCVIITQVCQLTLLFTMLLQSFTNNVLIVRLPRAAEAAFRLFHSQFHPTSEEFLRFPTWNTVVIFHVVVQAVFLWPRRSQDSRVAARWRRLRLVAGMERKPSVFLTSREPLWTGFSRDAPYLISKCLISSPQWALRSPHLLLGPGGFCLFHSHFFCEFFQI